MKERKSVYKNMSLYVKWISFKSQKPRKGIRVLVVNEHGFVDLKDTDDAYFLIKDKWMWDLEWEEVQYSHGLRWLHWAYLPDAPKTRKSVDNQNA